MMMFHATASVLSGGVFLFLGSAQFASGLIILWYFWTDSDCLRVLNKVIYAWCV